MFKISIVDAPGLRRIVVEGKLVPPWAEEVERAWRRAVEQLDGRKLVIDLTNVTLISPESQDKLLQLMKEGAKFSGRDVLTKHVLQQLSRRFRCQR